jgi:CheY-like chemotaxis protein
LESAPGKGSRFTISLPWKKGKEEEAPRQDEVIEEPKEMTPAPSVVAAPKPKKVTESQYKILIAEDDEGSLDVLSDFLLESGYRIVLARKGNEVLELAPKERPDLILLDIQMPGMNGLEVIGEIRANEDLKTIPIIVMTALAMYGDREQCLAAGANDYLSKPLSLKGLVSTIQQNLR